MVEVFYDSQNRYTIEKLSKFNILSFKINGVKKRDAYNAFNHSEFAINAALGMLTNFEVSFKKAQALGIDIVRHCSYSKPCGKDVCMFSEEGKWTTEFRQFADEEIEYMQKNKDMENVLKIAGTDQCDMCKVKLVTEIHEDCHYLIIPCKHVLCHKCWRSTRDKYVEIKVPM